MPPALFASVSASVSRAVRTRRYACVGSTKTRSTITSAGFVSIADDRKNSRADDEEEEGDEEEEDDATAAAA